MNYERLFEEYQKRCSSMRKEYEDLWNKALFDDRVFINNMRCGKSYMLDIDSTFRELVNKYRIELEFSAYSDESYKKFKAMRYIYNACVLKERYKCKEGLDE